MKWYRLYNEEVEISPEEEKDYKFKFKKGDVVYLPDGKEGTVVGFKIHHQLFAGDYYKLYPMYEVLHEVTRLGGKKEMVTSWYGVDDVYDNQKDAEKRAADEKDKRDKERKKWLAYHSDDEEDNVHPWGLYGRRGKGGSPNWTGD